MRRRARMVVTTQKDATKVPDMSDYPVPLYTLTIEMEIIEGEDVFWEAVDKALANRRSDRAKAGGQLPE